MNLEEYEPTMSASGAERWMNCAASARWETARAGERMSNPAADEGTVAHYMASCILKGEGLPPTGTYWVVPSKGEVVPAECGCDELPIIEFTDDMWEYVRLYTDPILGGDYGDIVAIEERREMPGGLGGTADCVTRDGATLYVHDLKYGFNKVTDFTQLMIYAGCYSQERYPVDVTRVCLLIHQVRLDDTPNELELTVEELNTFLGLIRERHASILDGNTTAAPGKWCTYCKAGSDCKERNNMIDVTVKQDLAMLPKVDAELIPAIPLRELSLADKYKMLDMVKSWCNAVETQAQHAMIEQGQHLEGLKVVESRAGAREWKDKAEAENELRRMKIPHEFMYDRKVISPTKAEKEAKAGHIGPKQWKKLQDNHITRREGKLIIVPEDDKRPAVGVGATLADLPKEVDPDPWAGDLV